MNIFFKCFGKFKSFYNDPVPFKSKKDEFTFMFSGMSIIIVIFGITIFYFIKEYVLKGFYEYVAVGIIIAFIILIYFFTQILKNIIDKSQTKNNEPRANENKEVGTKIITDEEKLKSFFNEGKFEEFKAKAIANNILDKNFKWIFDDNQKYPTYFYHYLVERDIIKRNKTEFTIKAYVELTNKIFGLETDKSMYSKPKYIPKFNNNKEINLKVDSEYLDLMIFEVLAGVQ